MQQATGVNAMVFYSNSIYNNISNLGIFASLLTCLMSVLLISSNMISGYFLIDKYGRRIILLLG